MTLIEGFIENEIFIDFGAEVIYGSDQVLLSKPEKYVTAEFQLMATSGLSLIADRIRKDAGFVPFHPMDEYTEKTCDNDGWYDFFISITDRYGGEGQGAADTCIEFTVVNSDSPDNEESYTIDLTADERGYIYECLEEQCRRYLGKSCEELLGEARKEIED